MLFIQCFDMFIFKISNAGKNPILYNCLFIFIWIIFFILHAQNWHYKKLYIIIKLLRINFFCQRDVCVTSNFIKIASLISFIICEDHEHTHTQHTHTHTYIQMRARAEIDLARIVYLYGSITHGDRIWKSTFPRSLILPCRCWPPVNSRQYRRWRGRPAGPPTPRRRATKSRMSHRSRRGTGWPAAPPQPSRHIDPHLFAVICPCVTFPLFPLRYLALTLAHTHTPHALARYSISRGIKRRDSLLFGIILGSFRLSVTRRRRYLSRGHTHTHARGTRGGALPPFVAPHPPHCETIVGRVRSLSRSHSTPRESEGAVAPFEAHGLHSTRIRKFLRKGGLE